MQAVYCLLLLTIDISLIISYLRSIYAKKLDFITITFENKE